MITLLMLDQILQVRYSQVIINQLTSWETLFFDTLFFTPTTPEEILNLKSIIKDGKSPGFGDINPSIVKKSLINIVHPFSHIFNLSLSTGVVPSSLKVSEVIPVLKSGDPASFVIIDQFLFCLLSL